ncbi:MAG TPA: 50S ribosomal protein L30 [Chroococcales cyanobacterium]|jgi:large subunit ribosomal protein L30
MENKKILVTLYKSPIGYTQKQRDTVVSLGLKRMNQTVEHFANPEILGMTRKIPHLVSVKEI